MERNMEINLTLLFRFEERIWGSTCGRCSPQICSKMVSFLEGPFVGARLELWAFVTMSRVLTKLFFTPVETLKTDKVLWPVSDTRSNHWNVSWSFGGEAMAVRCFKRLRSPIAKLWGLHRCDIGAVMATAGLFVVRWWLLIPCPNRHRGAECADSQLQTHQTPSSLYYVMCCELARELQQMHLQVRDSRPAN